MVRLRQSIFTKTYMRKCKQCLYQCVFDTAVVHAFTQRIIFAVTRKNRLLWCHVACFTDDYKPKILFKVTFNPIKKQCTALIL